MVNATGPDVRFWHASPWRRFLKLNDHSVKLFLGDFAFGQFQLEHCFGGMYSNHVFEGLSPRLPGPDVVPEDEGKGEECNDKHGNP